jgi:hypothetical protein
LEKGLEEEEEKKYMPCFLRVLNLGPDKRGPEVKLSPNRNQGLIHPVKIAQLFRQLPEAGFTVYNMVYRIQEGSGAPTRIFAILDGSVSASGSIRPIAIAIAVGAFLAAFL